MITKLLLRIGFIIIAFIAMLSTSLSQNYALDFDDAHYVTVNNFDNSSYTGLTLEAWVNLDQYLSLPGTQYSGSFILMKEAVATGQPYGFIMVVLSSLNAEPGVLAFGLDFDDGMGGNVHMGLHGNSQVPLNEWVHLACVWTLGGDMEVYINGELDGTLDVSSYGSFVDPSTQILHIGDRLVGPYNGATYGLIDEVRIWDVARSQSELRATMYQELTGNESNLVAYYQINEGSGQTVADLSPNSNDGYLGNNGTPEWEDPTWRSSTSPLPYYSINSGNWSSNATWAAGQNAPGKSWTQVRIDDEVNVNASSTVKNITISSSGALTIDASNTLSVTEDFLIASDNTGTGSFIDNGTLTATNIFVEQYLTQEKWHFVGIPTESATAGDFLFAGGSSVFLRTHVESTNSWGTWITDENEALVKGRGYEVWVSDDINQDETVTFEGTLNTGDITTGVDNFYDLEYTSGHGLNLISNPYPSCLQGSINTWTKTNMANSIWVWSDAAGNYLYWNGTDGTNGSGYGTLTAGVIPAMQGFFVEATGSNPSLTIPQSSRLHDSQAFYKSKPNKSYIQLSVQGEFYRDAVFVSFDSEATTGYDNQKDVKKIFGLESAPQLYTLTDGEEYSINALPEVKGNELVMLAFECSENGTFNFIVEEINDLPDGVVVYLEDKQENTFIELLPGVEIEFNHMNSNSSDRFALHFSSPFNTVETQELKPGVWTNGNFLFVRNTENEALLVDVFDLSGKQLDHFQIDQQGVHFYQTQLKKGIYIVKMKNSHGYFSDRILIQNP